MALGWRCVGFLYILAALYFVRVFRGIGVQYRRSHTWSEKKNIHVVRSCADVYDIVISG